MLILTRKPGERLHIDGGIIIEVMEVNGSKVRIGIEAPAEVKVLREELLEPTAAAWTPGRTKESRGHASRLFCVRIATNPDRLVTRMATRSAF